MKILLIHNFYGSSAPSGENIVFAAEADLLRQAGHDVDSFTRNSDEIRSQGKWGTLKGAFATPWNPWMALAVRRKLEHFHPDVVHVHNTFPLLSPAIFSAIGNRAARVLTLHNYRLYCPAGVPMRAGKVCTACLGMRSSWPGLWSGCYRQSRLATLPLAFSVGLHRILGTWSHGVEAFIVLSKFQGKLMSKSGLPAASIYIKPNFYPGRPIVVPWPVRKPYVIFAGRLSAEKGVASLVRAWQSWGINAPELRILGDGELRQSLEIMASGLSIRFMGQVSSEEAQSQIAQALLLVLPSECYEGFPMVVREAFAFGTPVAVSDLGPLPDIVQHGKNGLVFKAADPESLLQTVRTAWESTGMLELLGSGACTEFETKYTEEANYEILMDIYQKAIEASRHKG